MPPYGYVYSPELRTGVLRLGPPAHQLGPRGPEGGLLGSTYVQLPHAAGTAERPCKALRYPPLALYTRTLRASLLGPSQGQESGSTALPDRATRVRISDTGRAFLRYVEDYGRPRPKQVRGFTRMEGLTVYGGSDRLVSHQLRVSVGQINASIVTLPSPGRGSRHAQDQVAVDLAAVLPLPASIAGPIARPIARADCEVIAS